MGARLIRVFDTHQKLPPVGSGKDIIKQPNIGCSHMGDAGWARSNTHTDICLAHDDFHATAAALACRICSHQAAGSHRLLVQLLNRELAIVAYFSHYTTGMHDIPGSRSLSENYSLINQSVRYFSKI